MTEQGSRTVASRRIRNLGIAVVAFCLLYTGAWFYAADQIKKRLAATFEAQTAAGQSIECGNMRIKGFPFRLELFCDNPGLANLEGGGSVEVAALRSAAQVYAPFHIVWEMDGPLDATLANGEKLQASWTSFQSSLQVKKGGLERSSMASDGLQVTIPVGAPDALSLKAGHGEAHVRQNGEDLDAALLLETVSLKLPGQTLASLPAFAASIDATAAGKAGALDGRIKGPDLLHPAKGEIRKLAVDFGDGRVATLSGPVEVDEAGMISGKLALQAENFAAWGPMLAAALPDAADNIQTAVGALKAMADDKGTVRVNLVLDKGQVMLGFIPLGIEIPPV